MTPTGRLRAAAIVGGLFAALAVVAGTRVLSGLDVPDYPVLPWLVRYNVGAGAAGVVVAIALWQARRWASVGAFAVAGAHALVLAVLGARRLVGASVADDSLVAMGLRTLVWVGIVWAARAAARSPR